MATVNQLPKLIRPLVVRECPKSLTGKHRFAGYPPCKASCVYCGAPKDDAGN